MRRGRAGIVGVLVATLFAVAPAEADLLSFGDRPVVTAVVAGDGEVALTWEDEGYATGYWVYRDRELVGVVDDDGPRTLTWTDVDAPNGRTVVYVVGAVRLDGAVVAGDPVAASPNGPHGYRDVPSGNTAVRWVTAGDGRPYLTGSGDRFRPAAAMTRGAMVRLLYNWVGRPPVAGLPRLRFTDVPAPLRPAARWAVHDPDTALGPRPPVLIVSGDRFRSGLASTRAELVGTLHRLMGSPTGNPSSGLTDVPVALRSAVNWATNFGIVTGFPNRTFRPNLVSDRLEATAALHRVELAYHEVLAVFLPEQSPGTDWTPPVSFPPGVNAAYAERPPWFGEGEREFSDSTNAIVRAPVLDDGVLTLVVRTFGERRIQLHLPEGVETLEPGLYADDEYAADPDMWPGPEPDHWGEVQVAGCAAAPSWFAIDSVAQRPDGTIAAIDVRHGSACSAAGAATETILGAVSYDADRPFVPPAPLPVPDNAWSAAPSAVPAEGNYAYFTGESGDWVSQGRTELYTGSDARLQFVGAGAELLVRGFPADRPREHHTWSIDLPIAAAAGRLREGFFTDLDRVPFHNEARGGMAAARDSHTCGEVSGWVIIDHVAYEGDEVVELDLRFENHCTGADQLAPAVRGQVHYDLDDVPEPLSPRPVPVDFWAPPSGATPGSGSFLYLEPTAPTEPITRGTTYLYAAPDAGIRPSGGGISISQSGRPTFSLQVDPSDPFGRLVPGFYERMAPWGTISGWFGLTGNGSSCNSGLSDVVVDDVAYDEAGALTLLRLRFEQECSRGGPLLRGELRWEAEVP